MTDAAHALDQSRTRTIKRGGRFVTDAELIEYLGVPEKLARQTLHVLDHDTKWGFPKKQPIWGNRRDMRAVEYWLDKQGGLPSESAILRDILKRGANDE